MTEIPRNKRQHVRKPVNQQVSVRNVLSDELIGALVDVHSEGFLVLGKNHVEAEHVYQLELIFSEAINGDKHIHLGAECLWNREAGMGGQSWLGFHIIDIADADKEKLNLIAEQIQE